MQRTVAALLALAILPDVASTSVPKPALVSEKQHLRASEVQPKSKLTPHEVEAKVRLWEETQRELQAAKKTVMEMRSVHKDDAAKLSMDTQASRTLQKRLEASQRSMKYLKAQLAAKDKADEAERKRAVSVENVLSVELAKERNASAAQRLQAARNQSALRARVAMQEARSAEAENDEAEVMAKLNAQVKISAKQLFHEVEVEKTLKKTLENDHTKETMLRQQVEDAHATLRQQNTTLVEMNSDWLSLQAQLASSLRADDHASSALRKELAFQKSAYKSLLASVKANMSHDAAEATAAKTLEKQLREQLAKTENSTAAQRVEFLRNQSALQAQLAELRNRSAKSEKAQVELRALVAEQSNKTAMEVARAHVADSGLQSQLEAEQKVEADLRQASAAAQKSLEQKTRSLVEGSNDRKNLQKMLDHKAQEATELNKELTDTKVAYDALKANMAASAKGKKAGWLHSVWSSFLSRA